MHGKLKTTKQHFPVEELYKKLPGKEFFLFKELHAVQVVTKSIFPHKSILSIYAYIYG